MNTGHFPELMVLLAILASMVCWNAIKMIVTAVLTAMAVGFVFVVMTGMAGYGLLELLAR
jgi:hypothetical protein